MKIRPVGAELSRAEGWTDRQTGMTKQRVIFRNANTPKNINKRNTVFLENVNIL